MFKIDLQDYVYDYPWESLQYIDRISLLKPNTNRVVYFYMNPDNSTFRYRVYNMISVINNHVPHYSATFCSLSDMLLVDNILENCDILILVRVMYSDKINHMITVAKSRGIKVVYDVDDLVFDTKYTHLILNTLDQHLTEEAWNLWFSYTARRGEVLRMCDYAISTNDFLASKIMEYAQINCQVVPNFLNQDQIDISEVIWRQKQNTNFLRDDNIILGYFSGTPTHNLDFAVLESALIGLFKRYDNLRLRVVGYMEFKGELAKYLDRIDFIPFQNYVNLQRYIGEVEINLIPLQNNVFTNCKSELKYFEAAICGTCSIATPTYVYKNIIKDGVNGYLANALEWEEKAITIIENLDQYSVISQNAYESAVVNYTWYNQASLLLKTLEKISGSEKS